MMSSDRIVIGLLLLSAFFLSAAGGRCTEQNLDQQIDERAKLYKESLRQRAGEISPSFESKIESQARQTVDVCMEQWKNGKLPLCVALPRWAEVRRIAAFVSGHLPFSGSPASSFEFGFGTHVCALAVTSVSSVLKSFAVSVAYPVVVRSFVGLPPQNNDTISYLIHIVSTIVQRR